MYEDHPNHFYLSGLQIQLSPPRLPAPPPPTPDCKMSLVKRVRRDDCINRLLFETSSLAWISDDYLESFLLPCRGSKNDSVIIWNSGYQFLRPQVEHLLPNLSWLWLMTNLLLMEYVRRTNHGPVVQRPISTYRNPGLNLTHVSFSCVQKHFLR